MYRQRIREKYDSLSKSQKRIADYLLTSPRDAAFMSASRLAKELDVDVATVTRFAQRLKYPGYPELLEDVRLGVLAELREGLRPVEGVTDVGRAFVHSLSIARENLERTRADISMQAVEKAIDAILRAHTVYVLGQVTAAFLARRLAHRLQLAGIKAVPVGGDILQACLDMRDVGAEDVVIGIGFSGYAHDVAAVLRIAAERGATTIGISGSDLSAVARSAQLVLLCAASDPQHMPSETTATAVIEALAYAVSISRPGILHENVNKGATLYQEISRYRAHPVGSVEESVYRLY